MFLPSIGSEDEIHKSTPACRFDQLVGDQDALEASLGIAGHEVGSGLESYLQRDIAIGQRGIAQHYDRHAHPYLARRHNEIR